MSHIDAHSASRPHFTLPWSATDDGLPPGSWRVQWRGSRPVQIETSGDEIAIATFGRRWRFVASARPLLELLVSGRECAQKDLESVTQGSLNSIVIREFVRELVTSGLLVVR
jgi:hypothetical protein